MITCLLSPYIIHVISQIFDQIEQKWLGVLHVVSQIFDNIEKIRIGFWCQRIHLIPIVLVLC